MTTTAPIVIPFVCPICAGANAVHLISLSRAGGMDCDVCGKWLRAADVMRAMHSPRAARTEDTPAPRVHSVVERNAQGKRAIVWPPTAESRANAVPLRR